MKNQLGIAVIGCGQIAQAHLKAIDRMKSAQLIATVDAIEERAIAACHQFNARRYYTDAGLAFADQEINAVVLALPHHLHEPIAIQAAQARKHILVEKPMARSLKEAQAMCQAAEKGGVKLMVGQSTRFLPAVTEAKKRIVAGVLGEVYHCTYQRQFLITRLSTEWRYSPELCGGLYLPLFGSHDIDAILWWLDDMPTRVYSSLQARNAVSDGGDSDGVVTMEFTGGQLAILTFSTTSREEHYRATIIGSEGTLALSRHELSLNQEQIPIEKHSNPFEAQMQEFVDAIQFGWEEKRIASGNEVLRVMAVLDAAKASADLKQVVPLATLR
jgi:predicted dehydrogenase